ncbi:hypothetical protein F5Y11DRAFT_341150 [Daldinia sp. FL1419]|nr:hypothetical protein F5Y11DRAFT_341150 [Daldinia sp. FL1419]
MDSQPRSDASHSTPEDREIYGFGPDRRMPYSCPSCLGTSRLVKKCETCNGTGIMWDTSLDSSYEGEEKGQAESGESSTESSSLSSCARQS